MSSTLKQKCRWRGLLGFLIAVFATTSAPAQAPPWQAVITSNGFNMRGGTSMVAPNGDVLVGGIFRGQAALGALAPVNGVGLFVAGLDAASGQWAWAVHAAGNVNGQVYISGIAPFGNGDVVVIGNFTGTLDFGSAGTLVSTGASSTTGDGFVARLSGATKQWMWVAHNSSNIITTNRSVGVTAAGDVVICGDFSGQSINGPTPLMNCRGDIDAFVARLNGTTGQWQWGSQAGGTGWNYAASLVLTPQDEIFVTGRVNDNSLFGATRVRTIGASRAAFVGQVASSNGQWQWLSLAATTGDATGVRLRLANNGDLLVGGTCYGTTTFGALPPVSTGNVTDLFLARFLRGPRQWQWASRAGGPSSYHGISDLTETPTGAIVAAGAFEQQLNFAGLPPLQVGVGQVSGRTDVFVAQVSGSTGQWEWATSAGGVNDDWAVGVHATGSQLVLTGNFTFRATFGALTPVESRSSDVFVTYMYPTPTARITGAELLCNRGQLLLMAAATGPVTGYRWSTGATTASIAVTQPGVYSLMVIFSGGRTVTTTHTVTSIAPTVSITGDTLVCPGRVGNLLATAPGASSYLWSSGATTPGITVTQPGTYTVAAQYGAGCTATSQFVVQAPSLQVSGPNHICVGSNVVLTAVAPGATTYRWNTGATTAQLPVTQPGTYSVVASFANGCTLSATHSLTVPAVEIQGDTVLCPGTVVQLTAILAGATGYAWNTGATTATISAHQPGRYSVVVSYGTICTSSRQIIVQAGSILPLFSLGVDTTLCEGETLYLRAPRGAGVNYRWSNGATTPDQLVRQPGMYEVVMQNACGQQRASRRIAYHSCTIIPNIITPNNDLVNDQFVIKGLPAGSWSLEIYDRWGSGVYKTENYLHDWGEQAAPGIYFYALSQPTTGRRFKGWLEVVK